LASRLLPYDGPETRKFLRAGHQAALPSILSHGRIHLVTFDCMKRIPATYMLQRAREDGRLHLGQTVIDTSSGTFAIGLAEACEGRHPCVIVTDKAVDEDLKVALETRGARVETIDAPVDSPNVQALRKQLRNQLAGQLAAFIPDQYDNPHNPESYRVVAEIVTAKLGPVDFLVASIGSGGSSQGLGRALREVNPSLRIVVVDTQGSVLLGLRLGKRRLRGLGNSELPGNVAHCLFDEAHWVNLDVALEGVLRIAEAGLGDRGLTSGACWMVGSHLQHANPKASVVVVSPDRGWRYRALVSDYSGGRTASHMMYPRLVRRLDEVGEPWCSFAWKRRSLANARLADNSPTS
jgi:cysteine synthase